MGEWEERQKSRAEELVAIHDTIKLFTEKALNQLRRSPTTPRNSVSNLNLIALALSGRSVDFSKVISMIEEMVGLLKAEQVDDDDKKAYCVQSFDKTEDEAKVLAHQIAGHKGSIEDYKEQLSNTESRITAV